MIEPKQKIDIIKDDPDDNKVIECAIESSSDYIVTYDKHLIKLKEYKRIKIIKPEEILSEFWDNVFAIFEQINSSRAGCKKARKQKNLWGI